MLALSAVFLMKSLRLRRHLRLGEMLISINIVLWSATPSTTLSFLIRSGLFVNTRSRIYIYNSVLTCRQHIINSSASAPLNATKIAVKKDSDVDVCMFGPEL